MYKYRKVFAALKMNIMTEAVTLMCKGQFDVRKGPDSKIQFKLHFKGQCFAEMINSFGLPIIC